MSQGPSRFSPHQPEIKTDGKPAVDDRVVKVDTYVTPKVEEFTLPKISQPGTKTYAATRSKFGPLASTDSGRSVRSQKDSRFTINPLLRDPLSIEEEERRVIEEKVRARVSAAAAEARDRAHAEGYEAGKKQGYEEAYKLYREEGQSKLARLDTFIEECEKAKEDVFRANERFLVELVFRISKMVILRELNTDRELVLRIARDLLERVGVREGITLRVNAQDFAAAAQIREGLEKALGTLKNLNIETSPQVGSGGCMLETQWNAIDATIDTQLKGIYESLEK